MIMPLVILLLIVLIGCIIRYAMRPKISINIYKGTEAGDKVLKGDDSLYYGPKPTQQQEEQNKQRIFSIIEQFPNGQLATKNPEYVEEYLNRIDLDLPPGVELPKQ